MVTAWRILPETLKDSARGRPAGPNFHSHPHHHHPSVHLSLEKADCKRESMWKCRIELCRVCIKASMLKRRMASSVGQFLVWAELDKLGQEGHLAGSPWQFATGSVVVTAAARSEQTCRSVLQKSRLSEDNFTRNDPGLSSPAI